MTETKFNINTNEYLPLRDVVFNTLRDAILTGKLVPGERLMEIALAEKLGVSRNSVREALKILTVMGVVSSRQGAGNYISGNFKGYMVDALSMMFMLDKLDYDQINQIRIGLEMQAYALAVKNAETKDIIELQEYVNALDQSTDNDEKTMYDKKIHYAIAKASGNVLIVNILDALSEVMDIFIFEMRREILRTEKRKGMLQEAHKQIVECLLKRDVVNGQKALMKHFDMIDNIIHKEL